MNPITETNDLTQQIRWIYIGVIAGLLVSFFYPAIIFIPLPLPVTVWFIALLGPLLGLASFGLYLFIRLHRHSITALIGLISNVLAGMLFTTMLLVQIAIRTSRPESMTDSAQHFWSSLNRVHLGLDVAWDVYIVLGTLFFSLAIFRHPKLGKILSISGVIIAVALLFLNLMSFPIPPGEAGLIDLGPLSGLWYLAVTLKVLFSRKWIAERTVAT